MVLGWEVELELEALGSFILAHDVIRMMLIQRSQGSSVFVGVDSCRLVEDFYGQTTLPSPLRHTFLYLGEYKTSYEIDPVSVWIMKDMLASINSPLLLEC